MRGYLSVVGTDSGKVPVESKVAIFRDPGETQEIKASVDGDVRGLGMADVTVSRRKNDVAPVVLLSHDQCIEVRNEHNSNGVTVRTNRNEVELDSGYAEQVKRDASIDLGYRTELRLTVESEARIEVSGDYVTGNKIDKSTHLTDSVVNRSNVGAGASPHGGSAESDTSSGPVNVDDSVVNRSNVGGAGSRQDTQPTHPSPDDAVVEEGARDFCEVHERIYTGTVCPECGEAAGTFEVEAVRCDNCGADNPPQVQYCPDCGQEL